MSSNFVRVATLNMASTAPYVEERLNLMSQYVLEREIDVLCLQEVGSGTDASWAQMLAKRSGLKLAAFKPASARSTGGILTGVAILTRLPVVTQREISLPANPDTLERHHALMVKLRTPRGRSFTVISALLAWGPRQETVRLNQALKIDEYAHKLTSASDPDAITVLAGDFNTTPDSDTLRFLTGRGAAKHGTYWVDAWESAGSGDGFTASPVNPLFAQTARSMGFQEPSRLPPRRADFILVRGYVHAKAGAPLAARLAFDATLAQEAPVQAASDRFGVEADLWDPPIEPDATFSARF